MAALTSCTDPRDVGRALNDDAGCPRESCTDDTQDRLDAIARLDRVAEVERVSRSYGLDRGASRSAEVVASVDTPAAAREVAVAVLAELDDWPDQPEGSAQVVVRADGPPVRQSYVDRQTLAPEFYESCAPARCAAAVSELGQVLTVEVEGLEGLKARLSGEVLSVTAAAAEVPAAQAVKAILDRVETNLDLRVADRVEVRVDYVAPLAVTLRLEEGLVCEQPAGLVVACESDNSEPFPS